MTGAGLCKPFRSKERHTWCIPVKESSSVYTTSTTAWSDHRPELGASDRPSRTHSWPLTYWYPPSGADKTQKMLSCPGQRLLLLSVLQKRPCAFYTWNQASYFELPTRLCSVSAFQNKSISGSIHFAVLNVKGLERMTQRVWIGNESALQKCINSIFKYRYPRKWLHFAAT